MIRLKYTKAELESIVHMQLDKLTVMNDLINTMKHQNEQIENANKKLKNEVLDFRKRVSFYAKNN